MNGRAQLVKELQDNGFHFVRTGKHTSIFEDSHGETIGIAHTPSDWRVLANQRALIKKAVAKRPPEPIKESKTMAENYVITPKLQPVPQDHLDVKPDPTIVADRKQCKVCKKFFPVDSYRLAGPNKNPVSTCTSCAMKKAWETRRKAKAIEEWDSKPEVAAYHADERLKDEANAAGPFWAPPIKNPDFRASQRGPTPRPPARTKPNVIEQGGAETMAQRALVRRHRAEYDLLLEDMMAALGWDK